MDRHDASSLAVLSAKNVAPRDLLQWLYDFPFALPLESPDFHIVLNEAFESLTPNQLLEYMDRHPHNRAVIQTIAKEMSWRFSLGALEEISKSFHVDHPFSKAVDFSIHEKRMSGTITIEFELSLSLSLFTPFFLSLY